MHSQNAMKTTLEQIAKRALKLSWDKLGKAYGQAALGAIPDLTMNNRLKSTAGRAWIESGKIDLSTKLMLNFPREFIMQTIPHEAAHIAAYRVFGYGMARGESHGKPWQDCMLALDLRPEIYHNMLYRLALEGK